MRVQRVWAVSLLLVALAPALIGAGVTQYSHLVVFGDSLSDTGNVSIATGGLYPGDNYAPGRFTNGPNTTPAARGPQGLWVDQLAAKLGVPDPQPFLALSGGTNYAFASANTGSNGLFDISDQLRYFGAANPNGVAPNALVAIWGGANDLFSASNNGTQAATNLYNNILSLAADGGKTFLWFNLPPLGNTPRAAMDGNAEQLTAETLAFNKIWAADIMLLHAVGIDVIGVDVYSLFGRIAANPGAYGFTNLTTPAQGLANVNPDNYLFWDIEHPTTAGHAAIADLAFANLSVPEPATYGVVATSLGLLFALRKRRSARENSVIVFDSERESPRSYCEGA